MTPSDGFVFATTGPGYTTLARRAARTLKSHMPDAAIDLFTDEEVDDPVFDRIHRLSGDWFRPRMEALRRSRFERTICLDADIIVVADVSDLFPLLRRYDLIGAQATFRNRRSAIASRTGVPAAFPMINGGVIGVRAGAAVSAFLETWEQRLRDSGGKTDQPILRDLLWTSDLRFLTLGPEYNLLMLAQLYGWNGKMAAPRIIHAPELHHFPPGDPTQPLHLSDVMDARLRRFLARLQANDLRLTGRTPDAHIDALGQSIARWTPSGLAFLQRRLAFRLRRGPAKFGREP